MLATSWKATGLVEQAWKRLDPPIRDELARLTSIPASNLSGLNTGRLPMTTEMAQKIADAVPGLSVLELGAPEEEADAEGQTLLRRLTELEDALNRLGPDLRELGKRVRALEQRAQPKKRSGG